MVINTMKSSDTTYELSNQGRDQQEEDKALGDSVV